MGIVHIAGRVYTTGRAIALGLIAGTPGDAKVSRARPVAPKRVPLATNSVARPTRIRRVRNDQGVLVEPTEAGDKPTRRSRTVEPLMPKNVDHEGNVIEDPEVLTQIAEATAVIEADKSLLGAIPSIDSGAGVDANA